MSTIHIDKLLETTIKNGASDLHLHVGRPPTLRLNGRLRELKTKRLEPDDTMALMKAITPDRGQQELQEQGGCDFGFAFATPDGATSARFRVAVYRQKGNVSIVLRKIPYKLHDVRADRPPANLRRTLPAAPRPLSRHRAHRLGQDDHPRVHDQLHQ